MIVRKNAFVLTENTVIVVNVAFKKIGRSHEQWESKKCETRIRSINVFALLSRYIEIGTYEVNKTVTRAP